MSLWGSLLKVVATGAFFASQFVAPGSAAAWALILGGYVAGSIGSIIDRPKQVYESQISGMQVEPRTPIPVVYGRAKVSSQLVDWFLDPDYADAKILYQIVSLCHGSRDGRGIGKVEQIWFNDRKAITNPTSGELAESGGNDVREHPWSINGVDYQIFLGSTTQNVGGTDLKGLPRTNDPGDKAPGDITGSGWSNTTDTGKGIAAISFRLIPVLAYVTPGGGNDKAKAPIFTGPPSVSAIVNGNHVEDPRSAINVAGQPISPAQITFANANPDTITIQNLAGDDLSSWHGGDRIAVTGSASNDGIYTIASKSGLVLTLIASDTLTNEGPTTAPVLKRWAGPLNGGANPALCIRDYLLSTVYGWGLDPSMIDEDSFRLAADYCDHLIDYPLTAGIEQATRYTCNGVIDTGREVGANLDALCSSCRGGIDWSQGKARLVIRGALNLSDNPTSETDIVNAIVVNGSTVVRSTAQAHSGTASVKVTTADVAASGVRFQPRRKPTEPHYDGYVCTVGRSYSFSGWVYAPAGSVGKTLHFIIGCTDGLGAGIVPSPESTVTLVAGWQSFNVSGTILTGTKSVELYIHTGTGIAAGVFDFYVDDWSLAPDAVIALTPLNIIGQWSFRNAGNADRWNVVKATYIDPLNGEFKALETQWPPQGSNSYLTADNNYLNRLELPLPFTNDQPMAQCIAQIVLNEARNGIACQVVCTEEALIATVGDRVAVTHPTPGWTAKPFWVTNVELRADTTVALSLMEFQDSAYDLAMMEDRRDYPATSHQAVVEVDPYSVDPNNIVVNGDLELGLGYWTGLGGGGGQIDLETSTQYKGTASLRIAYDGGGSLECNQSTSDRSTYRFVRVLPGTTFNLSVAGKTGGVATTFGTVVMHAYNDAFSLVSSTDVLQWTASDSTWSVKTGTYTVAAGTYYVNLGLRCNGTGIGHAAYFDAIYVY